MTETEKRELAELIVARAAAELRLETAPGMQVTEAARAVGEADVALRKRIRALTDEAKDDLRASAQASDGAATGDEPIA